MPRTILGHAGMANPSLRTATRSDVVEGASAPESHARAPPPPSATALSVSLFAAEVCLRQIAERRYAPLLVPGRI